MEELGVKLQEWITLYGLKVLGAVVILLVGWWIAKILSRIVGRLLEKLKMEATLVSFLSRLTYVALLVFVIIAAVNNLGFQTTSFIAVIGAAGLAVHQKDRAHLCADHGRYLDQCPVEHPAQVQARGQFPGDLVKGLQLGFLDSQPFRFRGEIAGQGCVQSIEVTIDPFLFLWGHQILDGL